MNTDIVGPHDNRKNALPERKLEISDREEPAHTPETAGKHMIFNFDFFHTLVH